MKRDFASLLVKNLVGEKEKEIHFDNAKSCIEIVVEVVLK